MTEPNVITAGDTITWSKTIAGYSAKDWTLTYYFFNISSDFSITAIADNDNFIVVISSTLSKSFKQGKYDWKAVATRGKDEKLERHTTATGEMQVLADPTSGLGGGIDTRSEIKKALDAIDAVLANTASKEQSSYSIGGRSLSRRSPEELIVLRSHFGRLYAKEKQELRISQGKGGKRIYTRFGRS